MNRRFFIFSSILSFFSYIFGKSANARVNVIDESVLPQKSFDDDCENTSLHKSYIANDSDKYKRLDLFNDYITTDIDSSGKKDASKAINQVILLKALHGGGVVKLSPGCYKIEKGPVLIPSNISLELYGCILEGNGQTVIASGAIVDRVLIDITDEYGTENTGNGKHFVSCASIRGGRIAHGSIGIRAHRFNYNSVIENVTFEASLQNSMISSHSWGLKVSNCTFKSPAIMKDFVDWTEVSGNSFEGDSLYNTNYVALTISSGGYGGSFSARIISNGFHRMNTGILFLCECTNTVIESNHFESVVNHIVGNERTMHNFRILNNWMKANLLKAHNAHKVTPMSFKHLINSHIGPNYFSKDKYTSFHKYIDASSHECYGNVYWVGYTGNENQIFELLSLGELNQVVFFEGDTSSQYCQPVANVLSGSGKYTFEKYKAKYNAVENKIPFCVVHVDDHLIGVKTWVLLPEAASSFCIFNFTIHDSEREYHVCGFLLGDKIKFTFNDYFEKYKINGLSANFSVDGYLCVNFDTSLLVTPSITGWIKEL